MKYPRITWGHWIHVPLACLYVLLNCEVLNIRNWSCSQHNWGIHSVWSCHPRSQSICSFREQQIARQSPFSYSSTRPRDSLSLCDLLTKDHQDFLNQLQQTQPATQNWCLLGDAERDDAIFVTAAENPGLLFGMAGTKMYWYRLLDKIRATNWCKHPQTRALRKAKMLI